MLRLSSRALLSCYFAALLNLVYSGGLRLPSPQSQHAPFFKEQAQKYSDIATTRQSDHTSLPQPTYSGYASVNSAEGSEMFYVYYEAQHPAESAERVPIVLWLQGGPGCSSLFGMLYINGPYFVNEDLTLRPNPGSWNHKYGMLFMEQPIGVGFSRAGHTPIPKDELPAADHLYSALQSFFRMHPQLQPRPFFITGESYAGKYVPSTSHFILQATLMSINATGHLKHPRAVRADVEPPVFNFAGCAVGNGFTDAKIQISVQAQVAWVMGLIDSVQRKKAELMQAEILDLMSSKLWRHARNRSDELMAFITNVSATASLEDIRRNLAYDGHARTDAYLNLPAVKTKLGAPQHITWQACSPEVDLVMGHDVMKSVSHLVPDLLAFYPVMFYQGQFDAECGYAANEAWIHEMAWRGHDAWLRAERKLWMVNDTVAGYWKKHGNLQHILIRNTGHMVPHDNPEIGLLMLETWLDGVLREDPSAATAEQVDSQ